jgi:hypothetical protein
MRKSKILNLKITNRSILIVLLIVTAVAFVIARFPSLLNKVVPSADTGMIHLAAEKIYTIGLMAILGLIGFVSLAVAPLVAVLFFAMVATLGYHLYKKF